MPRHVGTWDGDRTRALLLDQLRREPGLHKSALGRAAGVPWGTLNHHLRRLSREGHVHEQAIGNRVHLFPGPPTMYIASSLGSIGNGILACLRREGALRVCDLCAWLGLSRKVVYSQLRRLIELGLVAPGVGMQKRYHLRNTAASGGDGI